MPEPMQEGKKKAARKVDQAARKVDQDRAEEKKERRQ